ITHVSENTVCQEDSDEVRLLDLRRLASQTVVTKLPPYIYSLHQTMKIAAQPTNSSTDKIYFESLDLSKMFIFNTLKSHTVKLSVENGNLIVAMPEITNGQSFALTPFRVVPGELLVPLVEVRPRNVNETTLVPIIQFQDKNNKFIGNRQLCAMPVGREQDDWTRRTTVVQVPDNAAIGMIMFVINSPDDYRAQPGSGYEIRKIQLV